jgi:LmbE family N-acetylglucosaminyl deacetylase
MTAMKERGISLPWDFDEVVGALPAGELNPWNAAAVAQVGEAIDADEGEGFEFGRSEDEITTRVDVSAHVDAKRASMECHKTQRQDLGWLLDLPGDLADDAISTEYFVLRRLNGADVPATHRETWVLP